MRLVSFIKIGVFLSLLSCNTEPKPQHYTPEVQKPPIAYEETVESEAPDQEIVNTGIDEFWSTLKIEKAKIFGYFHSVDWNEGEKNSSYIVNKNKLHPGIIDTLTKELDGPTINNLKKLISNTTNYFEGGADCFNPRHGIVFYNKKNEIIGHISICLECSSYYIFPHHTNHIPIEEFRKIIMKYKLPEKLYKYRGTK